MAPVAIGSTSPSDVKSAVASRHVETGVCEPPHARATFPRANGMSRAACGTAAAVGGSLALAPGTATVTTKLAGSGNGIPQRQAQGNAVLLARRNIHTSRSQLQERDAGVPGGGTPLLRGGTRSSQPLLPKQFAHCSQPLLHTPPPLRRFTRICSQKGCCSVTKLLHV